MSDNNGLSIRLTQGGQSFSLSSLPMTVSAATVCVEIDCPDCAVIPAELNVSPAEVLVAQGIDATDKRIVVCGAEDSPIRYAAALTQQAAAAAEELVTSREASVRYVTLLEKAACRAIVGGRRDKSVALIFGAATVYAAVADHSRLCYCDAVPFGGKDDLLYLAGSLNNDFDIRKADIYVLGTDSRIWCRMLKKYFRRCKCE